MEALDEDHTNESGPSYMNSTQMNDNEEFEESIADKTLEDNKEGLTSKWWPYFRRYKVDGQWKAECKACKIELLAKPGNGTSVLKNHVEKHCKKTKELNSTIAENFAKQAAESDSFSQEAARISLAKAIIMHEYPLSLVDHIQMRRFLSVLQPLFKCPSRNTIKREIMLIYAKERIIAREWLEKIVGRVAITSDMWTSNQKKGYMVVTAHYIDNSWKLQSRMLSFDYVPTPHTSEVLCDALLKVLYDWDIERKISTITLDNCSTNDSMIDDVLERLDTSCLLLGGKLLHVRCSAHILNLIVKDGLEIVKESIEKIRSSAAFWSATPKRLETFITWCGNCKVPYTKSLILSYSMELYISNDRNCNVV